MDSSNSAAAMPDGQIVHLELYCDSIERGRQFYGDLFGWTFKEWGDTSNYLIFMDAANKLGGGLTTQMQNTGAGGILPYIFASDINGKLAQIEAHGGRTLTPRSEIPGVGYYAVFVDPFGNHLGLFGEPKPM